jgi:hypothetical protein
MNTLRLVETSSTGGVAVYMEYRPPPPLGRARNVRKILKECSDTHICVSGSHIYDCQWPVANSMERAAGHGWQPSAKQPANQYDMITKTIVMLQLSAGNNCARTALLMGSVRHHVHAQLGPLVVPLLPL